MATPQTDGTGKIQKASEEPKTLFDFAKSMQNEIARALPKHITPDRMARVILTAVRTVPDLARCTQASFAGCVLQCAQLGLEPNTPLGFAYLIPRRNGKASERQKRDVWECTMVIGYQGFLELSRRAGVNSYAHAVRQGDVFDYELGLNPTLKHKPGEAADREKKPITHVYAVARTKEFADLPIFVVLSRSQIDARRARAQTQMIWKSDEEAMTQKTGIRALWKWMPKTVEMATAESVDEATESGKPLAAAFDPAVTAALTANGLQHDEEGDGPAELVDGATVPSDAVEARQGQAAIDYDRATGEVRQ